MLPFGRSDGEDPYWHLDSVAEENRDWVPTTTAALFSSPFYLTNQQGNLLGPQHQPHVIASAGVSSASAASESQHEVTSDPPLRPAGTAGTAADNLNSNPVWPPVWGNFVDHFDSQWQLPPASSAPAHHAHISLSPTELPPNWTGHSNARELLGSSSYLPGGGGLGDTQKNKIDQRDLAPETPALPRPASTSAKTASPIPSANTRSRLSASVPPAQTSPISNKGQSRTTLPKTTSPTRKRAREGIPKSPAAKLTTPRAPIQPNEEEQARRIHMAAYTRGTSLVSETSSQSRGAAETSSAKRDNDLRAAESSLLETMGAGRVPGVLRTPNMAEGASEEFALPLGKGFPIQIGSELFRLSGASILSDCKQIPPGFSLGSMLRFLEHPRTFRGSSKNNFAVATTLAVV